MSSNVVKVTLSDFILVPVKGKVRVALVFLENEMEIQESNVGSICLPTFREEFTNSEKIDCRVNR